MDVLFASMPVSLSEKFIKISNVPTFKSLEKVLKCKQYSPVLVFVSSNSFLY